MDIARVDPAKLRHFLAVLTSGSFALAAQTAGVSQPAISKSIRSLEEAIGVKLFERGRAGARPTRYANILASHARAIIAEYDLAQAEFHALKDATDQDLAIGASLSLAQSLLPKAIARFRHRWPMVSLSVEVGLSAPLFERLLGGDLDLVLSAPEEGITVDPRISRTFLLEEQDALVVGASHPLLARTNVQVKDLLDFPWIVPRRSARLERIHGAFSALGLPPPSSVLRSEASELARGLLTEAPFICLIGKDILKFEIESGRLEMLPDFGFANTRPAFLSIRRGTRPRSASQNLSTIIADIAKEMRTADAHAVAGVQHSVGLG